MRKMLWTGLLLTAVLAPEIVAQDAREVIDTMRERQIERWATVENYTVYSSMEGFEIPGMSESGITEIPTHYQKHLLEGGPAFGVVPGDEYMIGIAQAGEGGEHVTPEFFEAYAEHSENLGDALDSEMRQSGLPILPGMNYPGEMARDNAMYARENARVISEAEEGDFGKSNAEESFAATREMAETLELVGRDEIDGREAFHLRADGLDRRIEGSDGGYFTVRTVEMWVDAEHFVTLKMSMTGDVESDGREAEMTLERLFQDYRAAGPLYESHRQVMRMTGLMDALSEEDRKQLEEAQKQMEQLEEMEEELARMPAAARRMVEGQIANARRQMEMLGNQGGFEMVTTVHRITINEGPPPPGSRR